jgi:hypothetical protein
MYYFVFTYIITLILLYPSSPIVNRYTVDENVTVVIEDGSYLKINGSTNVNTFSCNYQGDISADTLNVNIQQTSNRTLLLKQASLSVEVERFDCGNKMMNKDFRHLLEYDEYANLKLSILSLHISEENHQVIAETKITIAGREQMYDVPIDIITAAGSNSYQGKKRLDITDFKLTPPKKFLGMVVVDEQVIIDFNLNLRLM